MHNENSPGQVIKFFKEKFDKRPLTVGLTQVGIRPGKKSEFEKMFKPTKSESELKENESFLKRVKISELPRLRRVDDFSKTYSGYVYDRITPLLQPPGEPFEYVATGTCQPFKKNVFVTVNGKLIPCERIMQSFYMGTITKGNIHLDYQQIADRYNGYYKKLSKLCNNCYNSRLCDKCIFHLNVEDDHVNCDSFLGSKDFSMKVSHTISLLEKIPRYYERSMKNLENTGEI
jgi:uncharacterized protein